MCGIAGILNLSNEKVLGLEKKLNIFNEIQEHRGPDDHNIWALRDLSLGLSHRRLSIIDLEDGVQPMKDRAGNCLTFNGEIYNYIELQKIIGRQSFETKSDTEVILKAYQKWGLDCVQKFRGMFSFALWDDKQKTLFCARDFFGIKPFYYTVSKGHLYFASEIKALLPFVDEVETDTSALKEYLSFQFVLGEKTLFKNIYQLPPGHMLIAKDGHINIKKYWDVYYNVDNNHTEKYFEEKLQSLLEDSLKLHTRSDVPIGGYLSGGLDSSTVCTIANNLKETDFVGFTGKFSDGAQYDESKYAQLVADRENFDLEILDIKASDFIDNIRKVIYHLDYPVAGPGSFSQYMISKAASKRRKVLLGGQGGDEIFGGYTRYLIAYFEQCIKAAIDGTLNSGDFIVSYESIIPNLRSLQNYKPLMQKFWKDGLFETMDKRYFSLINRMSSLDEEINWDSLGEHDPYSTFQQIFHGENVDKRSYFDLMTHFDFKTLLPALLQVEDRVSMAHGVESRVPLLDRPYVEFAATIPSNIKFENGNMKNIFKKSIKKYIPKEIINRKDKMGFPTPFAQWSRNETRDFIIDNLSCQKALQRDFINNKIVVDKMSSEQEFGRSLWGFLSLELWQQEFHDKAYKYKNFLKQQRTINV